MTSVSGFRRRPGLVVGATTLLLVGSISVAARAADAPPSAPVERTLVPPATGRGLSTSILDRAHAILLSELWAQCGCPLFDPQGPPQAQPVDQTVASTLAVQFNADVVVALDLAHAGPQTRFTLALFRRDPRSGQVGPPHVLTESTNEGPDRVGAIVHALVGRLYQRFPDPPPHASIQAMPRRYYFSGALGVLGQLNTAGLTNRAMPAFALALARYDETSIADLRGELAEQSDARRTVLGVSYSFRFGPHWSAGLAADWVWQHLGGRGATGAALQPLVGYFIPISGGPSFRIEGGYVLNLFQEKQMDRLIPGSDAAHWSHGPQLVLGVVL